MVTMTFEHASKIFKVWQEYVEISNKMSIVFHTLPESFLPYPLKVLEEALNFLAKRYHDAGDIESSELIKSSLGFLAFYSNDESALEEMQKVLNLMADNPSLKEVYLTNLKDARDSWAEQRASQL
jgi:hypothetical protein